MRSAVVAPLIGRESELELLANTFERASRDRRAHLVTVYGEPGVGKSRLVREFVASLEGATVLAGRCLPYGEGITYWPLAEMVKSSAGITDDDPVQEAVEKLRKSLRGRGRRRPARARLGRPRRGRAGAQRARRSPGRRARGPTSSPTCSRSCSSSRTSTGPRSRCSS